MTTTARIGWGAQLWLGTVGTPTTPVQVAEITSISLPNPQTAEVEATHFGSPNRRREYIAGLIEDGEGEFGMNLDPGSTSDVNVRAAIAAGITVSYKIVIPDAGSATWEVTGSCIPRGYERAVPIDDRMTATLSVRFTGASTEAAGA